MPTRVQLRRKKGWKMPRNTVKVSRPTKYGNPHRVGWCSECGTTHTQADAVAEFRALAEDLNARIRADLRGKNLACWCKPGDPCHADVGAGKTMALEKQGYRKGVGKDSAGGGKGGPAKY